MDHPHDLYWLFNRYWWLIFPLFWMVTRIVRLNLGHSRANRALDIIKSYADQGKEPPPELLTALKASSDPDERGYRDHRRGVGSFFFFMALATGFLVLAFVPNDLTDGHHMAFVFVAIVMMGIALSGLVNALYKPGLPPPDQRQ